MIKPLVLTSKAAQEHLDGIKLDHATLLQGITDQSNKVSQFKAEQDMKKQTENEKKGLETENNNRIQLDNRKMDMEAENKKLELENKRRELEIKAQALTMD